MKKIRIHHITEYKFSTPVKLTEHRLLLRPREGHDIRINSLRLDVSPAYETKWYRRGHRAHRDRRAPTPRF